MIVYRPGSVNDKLQTKEAWFKSWSSLMYQLGFALDSHKTYKTLEIIPSFVAVSRE